jgi:hypothetical protein
MIGSIGSLRISSSSVNTGRTLWLFVGMPLKAENHWVDHEQLACGDITKSPDAGRVVSSMKEELLADAAGPMAPRFPLSTSRSPLPALHFPAIGPTVGWAAISPQIICNSLLSWPAKFIAYLSSTGIRGLATRWRSTRIFSRRRAVQLRLNRGPGLKGGLH